MQSYYSRVLGPLAMTAYWVIPLLVVIAAVVEVARSARSRARGERTAAQSRDARALLLGAAVGAVASHSPMAMWLEARFAMLVVLPVVSASLGLVVSALVPPRESSARRVADVQPRHLDQYVTRTSRRQLYAVCVATIVIVVIRLALPPERPLGLGLAEAMGSPMFAPTRALYVVAGAVALTFGGLAWLAVGAVVRRSRPAEDAGSLARRDRDRRLAAQRVLAWSTASLVLLDAALLAPFPRKMGGIVFGDMQLIQRATDVLIVSCVAGAGWLLVLAHRPTTSRGVMSTVA